MADIRVLLVDDDDDFRHSTSKFLTKVGMDVRGSASVEEMAESLRDFTPNIILMDVNLPGENGFEAVSRLRTQTGFGLIMVTGRRETRDRIQGLTCGADVYLTKPVDSMELQVVIRNLWSRLRPEEEIMRTSWLFDVDAWTLQSPERFVVDLSSSEYKVVSLLLKTPGQPVNRQTLSEALGPAASAGINRNLDILISRLRAKFPQDGAAFPIKAVRNVGYAFQNPVRITRSID